MEFLNIIFEMALEPIDMFVDVILMIGTLISMIPPPIGILLTLALTFFIIRLLPL